MPIGIKEVLHSRGILSDGSDVHPVDRYLDNMLIPRLHPGEVYRGVKMEHIGAVSMVKYTDLQIRQYAAMSEAKDRAAAAVFKKIRRLGSDLVGVYSSIEILIHDDPTMMRYVVHMGFRGAIRG